MTLEEIFPVLKALLAQDEKLAAVTFLGQVAGIAADSAEVRDYNKHLEAALLDHGIALVAVVAEADELAPTAPILDLSNSVMLSIVENPAKNETGLTALQYVRLALRVLKRANTGPGNGRAAVRGARVDVSLARPAFNAGPLNKGTVIYFINLLVRTTEDLGPVNPV